MIQIHTSSLIPDLPLTFDVFIQVAGHHVRYVKKDDELEKNRLIKLKEKMVRHLFIEANSEEAYQKFLDQSLARLKEGKGISSEEKSTALLGMSKAAAQSVFEDPEKKENFLRAQEVMTVQVDHILKDKDALEQILTLESFDKSVYQHCVNVAALAVGLANKLEAPEAVCQVIGLGALMHDIGKTKLEMDPALTMEKLSNEDQEKLKTHARVGCEALQGKKYISKDVLDIILLHEERIDGKGYPGGVKKMDQIFQVVGLANMLDRLVTFDGRTHEEAYAQISSMSPRPYEKELIEAMKEVVEKLETKKS